MHVVSVEGRGVDKMSDLKGKHVSTGSPGSATEVMAFRIIEAEGLDKDKDMKRERLGVAESVNAIKDGKIDAFFWVGGLPTAGGDRPRQHAGHQDQDDRPRRRGGGDEQEVRQPVRRGRDPEGNLSRHGRRQQAGHGDEHPGRPRKHGRQDRLQHRQDHLRQARRPDRGAQGSRQLQAREPEGQRHADPVPSGRGEVLRRKRHQASIERRPIRRAAAPSRSATRRCTRPRSSSRPKKARPTSSRAG